MDAFEARYPGVLESCLSQPFGGTSDGRYYYENPSERLAVFFYLMNNNHPFINGNKRMAVVCLLATLYINGFNLISTNEDVYNAAIIVADSKPHEKEEIIKRIEMFIESNITNRNISLSDFYSNTSF